MFTPDAGARPTGSDPSPVFTGPGVYRRGVFTPSSCQLGATPQTGATVATPFPCCCRGCHWLVLPRYCGLLLPRVRLSVRPRQGKCPPATGATVTNHNHGTMPAGHGTTSPDGCHRLVPPPIPAAPFVVGVGGRGWGPSCPSLAALRYAAIAARLLEPSLPPTLAMNCVHLRSYVGSLADSARRTGPPRTSSSLGASSKAPPTLPTSSTSATFLCPSSVASAAASRFCQASSTSPLDRSGPPVTGVGIFGPGDVLPRAIALPSRSVVPKLPGATLAIQPYGPIREIAHAASDSDSEYGILEIADTPAPKGGTKRKRESTTAVHPWRPLAPVRRKYTRGSVSALDGPRSDARAIDALRNSKFAKSSLRTFHVRLSWWTNRCKARLLQPLPLNAAKVELAAALLRAGGYRTGPQYLSVMKRAHVAAGHPWTPQLSLAQADGARAIVRGMGPAKQAAPIPIEYLANPANRGTVDRARRSYWPAAGIDALVVCCSWLLREVEATSAFRKAVTVHPTAPSPGCGWASWNLPVDKNDQEALGKVRNLACACPSPLCPIRAMIAVLAEGERALGPRFSAADAPLLVKCSGDPLSKLDFALFMRDLANVCVPVPAHITGHSCRVTGAMRMALAGHHAWTIQLFGRWGSSVVLRYVREALLGLKGGTISAVTEGLDTTTVADLRSHAIALAGVPPPSASGSASTTHAPLPAEQRLAIANLATDRVLDSLGPILHLDRARTLSLEELLKRTAAEVESLRADFLVTTKGDLPKVVCSGRGVRHIVADHATTICGWQWRLEGAEPDFSCAPSSSPLCRTCTKTRRTGRGQPSGA